MTTVKVAFIGLGPRGQYLATLYAAHPNCRIVALCDRFLKNAEAAAALLGIADIRCYTDMERMISAESIDAVVIAAPPDIQVDMACYCMEKGIHVTTEVPAAYTIEECWRLVGTVRKTGVKYQLSEQTRYWGFIREWRGMARRREFGHILFAEGEYLHYMDWDYFVDPKTGEMFRGDPNPPQDREVEATWRNRRFIHPIYYLPHTLSPLLSITGGRVTRVSCMGTRPESYYVKGATARDLEVAIMHTSQDAIFRVAAGFMFPSGPRRGTGYHWYQVKGTDRTVEWARSRKDKPRMWSVGDEDWTEMNWTTEPEDANSLVQESGHGNADGRPVTSFLNAIIKNESVGMDVYSAVETAAPAILAAESSNEGGVMKEVPDFRESNKS